MAKTLNSVQLIGRLGADPELKFTQSGMAVATFNIATNRQWPGKDGTLQEETEWHTIVAWDKLAQLCSELLSKGRLVFIQGRLHTRSWESNGHKQYKTEIVASDMLVLDQKPGSQPPIDEYEPEPVAAPATSRRNLAPAGAGSSGGSRRNQPVEDLDLDEIPF
jgi:single-strand DNA-binding protein